MLIFGGLTLAIHDKAFIQWKVTIVNWLFAAAFLADLSSATSVLWIMGENVRIERPAVAAPELGVDRLLPRDGTLNLYVAYNSEEVWVNFKLYGTIGPALRLG